ncbi:hypothetical protein FW800_13340 [Pseudomonas sp. 910_23]
MSRIQSTISSQNEPNTLSIRLTRPQASPYESTTRHLADLLEKNCLTRLPEGGRSTRYQINPTHE